MSREPADGSSSAHRLLLSAAVVVLGLGAAGFALGDRLAGPPPLRIFGPLLLMLLGTVLALPALTVLSTRLLRPVVERVLGLPGRLAADHLIRTPGRSGFVIAALAGGMALILQTGGVIHGNAEAIRDWVDRSVMGDLFVTSGGPLSASGQIVPMRDDLGPRIEAALPGARAVPMRFHMLPWRAIGRETRVRLLAMDAARYVAANRGRPSPPPDLDVYARLTAPGTVLVSENFAALYGVKVGATLTLPGSSGPVPLQVAGTVTDFSCSRGTLIVDRVRYGPLFEGAGVDVFAVFRPVSPTPDEALKRRIEQAPWGAEQALCVLTRPELRRHILGMVDRLYAVAYIQEIVAAVVAALGVATALLISLLQRRRELGLLRALGATPAQARQIVLAEAALLTLLGLAFGLLIGVALEWYVLRVILLEETGFVFPFRFPWTHAALVAPLIALSGGLAALGPALTASRMGIHDAITYE
jgi:putative ABC transport system permease protein